MAISRHALTSATAPGTSIELECLYHSPQGKWAYAYNSTTFTCVYAAKRTM